MKTKTESLGICLGASTISLVRLRKEPVGLKIVDACSRAHNGNPRASLREMLSKVADLAGLPVAATGRKFRNYLALSIISEPEAVELAAGHVLAAGHPCRVIISAGGETFIAYHLDEDGRIQNIHTGNKCASGTGEFFLQQLGRMGITLAEVGRMKMPETYHKLSGRCSVFCKSDCTHALNKGVPKPEVIAGLTRMMAGKVLELLKKMPKTPVLLIGGCSGNQAMIHYLRKGDVDLLVPSEAPYFEALGAALWALSHECRPCRSLADIFVEQPSNLTFLKALADYKGRVHFRHQPRGKVRSGDRTIIGLDVGSTTTKGVIMRRSDKAILAADYLRTNGDPVGASRRVYQSLAEQIGTSEKPLAIEGLGVTGSGRQIAGLHAMTDGVINEIIAHATAAVYFDPEVDTIFEIGGQDAKYTYITNGVPSDYAMNEACSAGTGSFLEEAARESLGLAVDKIGQTAYQGARPPNFSDQCAAFIGSDIKGASQEGIPLADIVAGLVYSICMNYTNRVKGNRPVGKKVFIQGGVCYNEALPAAMSALTGKDIVVPPDPGLMGAFGVALEVERRMEQGLLQSASFNLHELEKREVKYGKPFKCGGGKEKCDRGCMISRIEISGRVYPFGGICNRYDNLIHKRRVDTTGLDLVVQRERLVFRDLVPAAAADSRPTVGMNRSFLVNTFFPFYNRFFAELGFRLLLPDNVEPTGIEQQGAAFCYPVALAHGYAANLLTQKPDFIFLPHLRGIPAAGSEEKGEVSCACPFAQGEPFYLKATFQGFNKKRTITPLLDFSQDMQANLPVFTEVAGRLGVGAGRAKAALVAAMAAQESFRRDSRRLGGEALAALRDDPDRTAVVLFGRPYNSFASVANKGIPAKFASRNVLVIPFDMIPYEKEEFADDHNMYWAMGRMILQAAHYVRKNPQLFAAYITNFSCGPDSFIVGYFRDIMGRKPSLTLELDSHTADAGIETRIEAFLDIVRYYREIQKKKVVAPRPDSFRPALMEFKGRRAGIRASDGQWLTLRDDRVKVVLPAMGRFGTPLLAKSFARVGIRAEALPPADEEVLKLGRGNSTCKECLPLQTTVGSILHYLHHRRPAGEVTAYFMASADGPCRFGQYHVYSRKIIAKHRIPQAAVLSLTSSNSYGGLGNRFTLAAWRAIIIGDIFDEMWATILAGAGDREAALEILSVEYRNILAVIDKEWHTIARQLSRSAVKLGGIKLRKPYNEIPKLSLIGEIYVRHDPIALQKLVERMAARGFIVRTAQNSEWVKYVDWLVKNRIEGKRSPGFRIRYQVKRYFEREIRKKMARSGLLYYGDGHKEVLIEPLIDAGGRFISPYLTGEAILTVGSAFHEILAPSCGVISIGPFGCMPTRLAESILNEKFTTSVKKAIATHNGCDAYAHILDVERKMPFLAIETDGNVFPQIIEARLDAFCLQAGRLNNRLLDG